MPTSSGCAVFLGTDEKVFVIYMDRSIGNAIQRAVNAESGQRPMTHDLMIALLDGLGATVKRVIINERNKTSMQLFSTPPIIQKDGPIVDYSALKMGN